MKTNEEMVNDVTENKAHRQMILAVARMSDDALGELMDGETELSNRAVLIKMETKSGKDVRMLVSVQAFFESKEEVVPATEANG